MKKISYQSYTGPSPYIGPLIKPEKLRADFLAANPERWKNLTDSDWNRMAEQLSIMAKLLWRMSARRAERLAEEGKADKSE